MGSFVGKVILDSSVIIALFNDADAHHVAAMEALGESKNNFEISTVSLAEALSSVLSDSERNEMNDDLKKHFSPFHPVDEKVAFVASQIRAATKSIQMPDALISATAILAKAELWTFDRKLSNNHPGARLIA
jgi:predicted nucleic acid-binding protein